MQKRIIELEAKTDKLEKNLKDVSKQLDGINESVQSTADGFVDATKDSKKLNDSVKKTEGSTKNATQGFKKMGVALKAVGIGLLIAALGTLKELFQSNQRVVDIFSTAFETLSIIFSDFVNFVNNNFGAITKAFKDVFQNPIQSIKDFGNAIKDGLIDRFNQFKETIGVIGKSLSALFAGDFTKAFELAKKAAVESVDVITGQDDSVTKIKETFNEVKEAVTGYVTETIKAAKSNVQLANSAELAAVANQGLIEEFDRQAEKQRQIRDDVRLDIETRKKANDELAVILEQQQEAMLKNADIAVAAAQRQLAKDRENIEAKKALMEAENERKAVVATVTGFISEQKTNEAALELELKELTNSRLEAASNLSIEQKRFNAEQIQDNLQRLEAQKLIDEEEREIQTARLQAIIDEAQQGTQARIDAQIALAEFEEQARQQKVTREKEISDEIIAVNKKTFDNEKQLQQQKVQMTSDALGAISQLVTAFAGKDEEAQRRAFNINKAISIGQAIISTAQGIIAQLAVPQDALTGLNFVKAGIVAATGAAQVATISQTKFQAQGGSSPSSPSATGAGGGTGIGSQAPAFNVVGQSGFNQVAQALGQQNSTPIKAFVVSGDVTSAQALENNIIDTATF